MMRSGWARFLRIAFQVGGIFVVRSRRARRPSPGRHAPHLPSEFGYFGTLHRRVSLFCIWFAEEVEGFYKPTGFVVVGGGIVGGEEEAPADLAFGGLTKGFVGGVGLLECGISCCTLFFGAAVSFEFFVVHQNACVVGPETF